jgi:anti-anti-sigma regulatory factor
MKLAAPVATLSGPLPTEAAIMCELTTRRVGFRRLLAPRGPLCEAAASALMDAFWDAIESGAQEVWVDLSAVTAIETPGLDILGRLGVSAHELGRRVAVICPEGPARRTLARAGVGVEVYATVSAANLGAQPVPPSRRSSTMAVATSRG